MSNQIDEEALMLLNFLMDKRSVELNLPFLHSFPKNCCEVVSFLLKFILEERCQGIDVHVFKGSNAEYTEHHFWCVVNGLIYDLTAQQFENIPSAVIGKDKLPVFISQHFVNTEIVDDTDLITTDILNYF